MNHICTCKQCRAVIVEVVQGVLEEDMDLSAEEEPSTDETVEYAEEENPSEDTQ